MTRTAPSLAPPEYPLERIAFAGPMCSGKTYLANILVEKYDYRKTCFAKLLKEVAEKLYGPINKDNIGRKILQELSDDLKKWDVNLFMTHLMIELGGYIREQNCLFVVDDLRYLVEFDLLKKNGFTIIGVACSESVRLGRIFSLYPDTLPDRFVHPSETEWRKMNMDYWIDNTGIGGEVALDDIFGVF
jgi:dephospho-CoA kinase